MPLLKATLTPEMGQAIDGFIDRFTTALNTSTPFPISAFFDAFPVNTDEDTRQALINRGDISIAGAVLQNSGDEITGFFHDENLGDLRIDFPSDMSAKASSNGTEVIVDCRDHPIAVEFNSPQPIPINPLQLLFQVHAMKGSEVRYFFHVPDDVTNVLELKLSYSANPPSPELASIHEGFTQLISSLPNTARGRQLRSRLALFVSRFRADDCCPPFCMEEPVEPSDDQPDEPADPPGG